MIRRLEKMSEAGLIALMIFGMMFICSMAIMR